METTTLAWHDDPALKAEVMARLRQHREQDTIVQGVYQRLDPAKALGYRGCAIGCTLPAQAVQEREHRACDCCQPTMNDPAAGWHGEVEDLYGIDQEIAETIDDIFESLPTSACAAFAVEVVDAIPVGANLNDVTGWCLRLNLNEVAAADAAEELIAKLREAPVPAFAAN